MPLLTLEEIRVSVHHVLKVIVVHLRKLKINKYGLASQQTIYHDHNINVLLY